MVQLQHTNNENRHWKQFWATMVHFRLPKLYLLKYNFLFQTPRLSYKWTFFQYKISITQTHWFRNGAENLSINVSSQFQNKRMMLWAIHGVYGGHQQHRNAVIGTAFHWHAYRTKLLLVACIPIAQPKGKILTRVPSIMCGKLNTVRQNLCKSTCLQGTGHYSFRSTSVRTPVSN
jgi:hypothetical protein